MNDPRESDLLEAQLDLVDLSGIEDDSIQPQSIHQASTLSSKGFCVKEYEEQMDSLKKENFNLKLRLYFLEQNNVTLPEGIENFQKQFADLKNENETLTNDLKEKQDLLQQASLALELLEEEKSNNLSNAEMVIGELRDRVKGLEQEKTNLQQALNDLNKSNLGNDTGYAEFLGAVDMRDIELQRKVLEMSQLSEEYKQQVDSMNQEILKLKSLLKDTEGKMAMIIYEREEMYDKYKNAESESKLFMDDLKNELKDFKEKWAASQCELHDTNEKLKDCEEERQKTLKYLKQCLQTLDEERQKVMSMETIVSQKQISGIDKNEAKKDAEILDLKTKLEKLEQKLKVVTTRELEEKNQEIEKLTQLINKMKIDGNKSLLETPRFSFDHLYESFNDLKFQQAMEVKKQSQKKINELMQELIGLANSKTKEQVIQLQEQMAIVVEKQELADDALNRCAELCSYTLDHLHELAQFLATLLQNKEIRESLSNQSLLNIQNILDKSIEFSRYSIDGRISGVPDLSMIGNLINSARDSIANIREKQLEIVKVDKSIQSIVECESCGYLKNQLKAFSDELEELKKVNQLLEDEICEHQNELEMRDEEIKKCNEEIKSLKDIEMETNVVLEDYQNTVYLLQVEKVNITTKLEESEVNAKKLQERFKEFEDDLKKNWMLKKDHEESINKIRDEVVNAEAQTAAIRLELEEIRNIYPKYKLNSQKSSMSCDDFKENDENGYTVAVNDCELAQNQNDRKMEYNGSQVTSKLEYTDEKHQILMSTETSSTISCRNCPKYQGQIKELKKYLHACYDKLKRNSDRNAMLDHHIQKQLNKTENYLQQARSNMENILKNKENMK